MSQWTSRQKLKVAIPIVVAVLLALSIVASSQQSKYTVVNGSGMTLLVSTSSSQCQESYSPAGLDRRAWRVLDYQETRVHFTTESNCLIVATIDRRSYGTAEFVEGSTYTISRAVGGFRIHSSIAPGITSDDDSTVSRVFGYAVLAGGGFGVLGAAFVTFRFFFRYYIKGDKTAQLR